LEGSGVKKKALDEGGAEAAALALFVFFFLVISVILVEAAVILFLLLLFSSSSSCCCCCCNAEKRVHVYESRAGEGKEMSGGAVRMGPPPWACFPLKSSDRVGVNGG